MYTNRNNNKRPVETFLVASGNAALYNTAGSGNSINNLSTGAVRLANGQLGIFSASSFGSVGLNIATDATPTVTEAPVIYIAQGTADSANPAQAHANRVFPLFARPFERSQDIDAEGRIIATYQAYAAPTNAVWVVGDTGALATGGIVVLDETEYALTIAYRGRIMDEYYNSQATASYLPNFVTPNYTTLGTAEPLDHLVQNLVWSINRNSRILGYKDGGVEPVIALALDLTGTVGTDVSAATAGDFLPIVTTNLGIKGITLDANMIATLTAALPSGATVVNVNLSTAGTADAAQAFAIVALDRNLSYEDRVPQVKIDIELGLRSGFDFATTQYARTSRAFEGEGVGRTLALVYEATHGQRKYTLRHTEDPYINFPNPVSTTGSYNVINILNYSTSSIGSLSQTEGVQRTMVLVPTADSTTQTQFSNALSSWLVSAGSALSTIS